MSKDQDKTRAPTRSNERVVFLNGAILPESRALLSFRDAGFVYGDAVFDTARTFNGVPFRLKEHVDRLFESLAYVRIPVEMDRQEIIDATEDVIARNRPLLGDNEDYWVSQRISRGVPAVDGEPPIQDGPTILIECTPLPLRARAAMFRDGIDAVVAPLRRVPPDALSPNAKINNYMNAMLSQREVAAVRPGAWAVQLDVRGNIAEGIGCNIFIVRDGVVITPTTDYILPGISRAVALELCEAEGIPVEERDVSMHLAATASEVFFTSTSLCLCPVRSLNGRPYLGTAGPVTKRLMDAFRDLVGMDYVQQYLSHLRDGSTARTGF
jgi:branched-chain amino acid aminotransferase